jgi:YVTN family beta-propeller protein
MRQSLLAVFLLVSAGGLLALKLGAAREDRPARAAERPAPVLPGLKRDGRVLLPNQWSLLPAGKQVPLGDFPVNLALHPSGQWLAVLHAGYGEHEIIVVELGVNRQRVTCRVPLEQTFYGLTFAPDGKALFASGAEFEVVHRFTFADGLLGTPRQVRVADLEEKFIPCGIATDAEGGTLYVAGAFGNSVRVVPVAPGADAPRSDRTVIALEQDSYPYTCLPEPGGKRLFVSLWGLKAVAVIDLAQKKLAATWPTQSHPTEMALSPDGKTLFVACSNSTSVSVLDTATGKALETINCALYPNAPSGNTPGSLALTPDGQLLYVACADANNVAVFNVAEPGKSKALGFIPVGWYPTSVRYNPKDRRLYVTNGKGLASKANPQGPGPHTRSLPTVNQYIASLLQGTLSVIDQPTPEQMAAYTKRAYTCSPLRADAAPTLQRPEGNPIPAKVGEPSPIRYVIYIIKENRTYDQVFGDMKEGNGDPNLCLFGEKVTPNQHKLAREFVLLDNFYVDGEVSADGHQWSMAAYATDFVEKVWPLTYRGSPRKKLAAYPSEGQYDSVARPSPRRASAIAPTASGWTPARRPTSRASRGSRRSRATSTRCTTATT